jgi:hypothetical protein
VGSIPAGNAFTRRGASFDGFENGKVRTNPLISLVVRPCLPMLGLEGFEEPGMEPVFLENNPAIRLCDFNEFLHLSA